MVLLAGISNYEKTEKIFDCTCMLSEDRLWKVRRKYEYIFVNYHL